MKREWFRVHAQTTEPSTADLYLFGDIGRLWPDDDAVSASDVVAQLAGLDPIVKTLRVHINSAGGDLFEGVAITNALRDLPNKGITVETIVEGLAASVASVIAMAGSRITMADNAMLMIHAPWSITIGNADDHRRSAETLDRFRDASIITAYKWHATLSDEALLAAIAAETWYDADEAMVAGFAHAKVEGLQIAAALEPRSARALKVPDRYRDRVAALVRPPAAPAPTPTPQAAPLSADDTRAIVAACDAAAALELVPSLLASNTSLEQARARIADVQVARTAAAERAQHVRAICARSPYLRACADVLVRSSVSVDDLKALKLHVDAAVDELIQIDGSLLPEQGAKRPGIDRKAIYDKMNIPLQVPSPSQS